MSCLEGLLWLAGIAVVVYLLDALAYRLKQQPKDLDQRGQGAALGNALLQAQAFLDPRSAHELEARQVEEREEDESGDPPVGGGAPG